MFRRITAILCAFTMLFAVLPVNVNAEEPYETTVPEEEDTAYAAHETDRFHTGLSESTAHHLETNVS